MTFWDKLKSRKLWLTIGSIALGAYAPALVPFLKILVPSYVAAQGIADAAGALKGAIQK